MSGVQLPRRNKYRALTVRKNRSATYDFHFLLVIHSNNVPISIVSEKIGDFGRKSQIFPTRV